LLNFPKGDNQRIQFHFDSNETVFNFKASVWQHHSLVLVGRPRPDPTSFSLTYSASSDWTAPNSVTLRRPRWLFPLGSRRGPAWRRNRNRRLTM